GRLRAWSYSTQPRAALMSYTAAPTSSTATRRRSPRILTPRKYLGRDARDWERVLHLTMRTRLAAAWGVRSRRISYFSLGTIRATMWLKARPSSEPFPRRPFRLEI